MSKTEILDFPCHLPAPIVPPRVVERMDDVQRRALLWRVTEILWDVSHSPRVRACARLPRPVKTTSPSRTVEAPITVHASGKIKGLRSCGAVNLCPKCSERARARAQAKVERLLVDHVGAGGTVLYTTVTVPRRPRIPLRVVLHHFWSAWTATISGRAWAKIAKQYGLVGSVRALEIVRTDRAWGPHVHVAWLARPDLTDHDAEQFRRDLHDRFGGFLAHQWKPSLEGIDVRRVQPGDVDSARSLAAYICKPQLGESAVAPKLGEGPGLAPFDLLRSVDETGDAEALKLFHEYEAAMRSKRWTLIAITTSKAARAARATDDTLHADEAEHALSNPDSPKDDPVLVALPKPTWTAITRIGLAAAVFLAAREGKAALVSLLASYGLEWLDPGGTGSAGNHDLPNTFKATGPIHGVAA